MDQVILFDKSLQERLEEYTNVLSGYEILPVSQIRKEWSFYTELAMDSCGWQAIWKIPRLVCESFQIPFPTIVLVYVENVAFDKLTALIKILAVQDDIHLPDEHIVPLIQLWPTKEQDKTVGLNMPSTTNALDMMRFFYNNLFMPWDYEEDDTSDWLKKHLVTRLRLYYDMQNGVIPRATAEHLKDLLAEAKRLQTKREQTESELSDTEDLDITEFNPANNKIQTLMDIHVRIAQIKGEVEVLEIPLMRNSLLRYQLLPEKKGYKNNPENWLIYDCGKIDEYITFLTEAKRNLPPDSVIKFSSSLADILDKICSEDLIILNNSKHIIRATGGIECGGSFKGLYNKEDTILASVNESVMLDCNGNVTLQNLTIDASFSQCGIIVRSGKVTIVNCKILGDGKSSTHQGIIVLSGGHLELVDCDITGFCTAIVGNSKSEIILKNCNICNANIGLKVYDNSIISARSSSFQGCKEYGICIETESGMQDGNHKIGDFAVLQIVPNIKLKDVTGKNNLKGDVIINNKPKIVPLDDLFSNPLTNSRLHIKESASDEEIETMEAENDLNNTVIENINGVCENAAVSL